MSCKFERARTRARGTPKGVCAWPARCASPLRDPQQAGRDRRRAAVGPALTPGVIGGPGDLRLARSRGDLDRADCDCENALCGASDGGAPRARRRYELVLNVARDASLLNRVAPSAADALLRRHRLCARHGQGRQQPASCCESGAAGERCVSARRVVLGNGRAARARAFGRRGGFPKAS